MKDWLKFFFFSFFSDKRAKEGANRGYTNVFVALVLAFVFLWAGFFGADMLPFPTHYSNSPDFVATVYKVLANPDVAERIYLKLDEDNHLMIKEYGGEYAEALFVNTYTSEADRESYSVNGYGVIVDSRPADTLAEVVPYCVSNDGKGTEISYEEYLTLSDVAKLNFDFKLRYTGNELLLTDELVSAFSSYLDEKGSDTQTKLSALASELSENKITKQEYNRAIYELYFMGYYPSITEYESASPVPLLRNYYYREYVEGKTGKYLFIFNDCMAGGFLTNGETSISFYGFYSGLGNDAPIDEGLGEELARERADEFIKGAFRSGAPFTSYAHAMNVFSLIPFIALMPMVVTLLIYSILKLRGTKGVSSLGSAFKIVGSYIWMSSLISAFFNVIISFFVQPTALTLLPILLFFVTLVVRSMIFAIREIRQYTKKLEQQTVGTED